MKKIGELKGMPIVEGNSNKIKKGLLQYKESNSGFSLLKRDEDGKLTSATGSGSNVDLSLFTPLDNTFVLVSVGTTLIFHNYAKDILEQSIIYANGNKITLSDFEAISTSCSGIYYKYRTLGLKLIMKLIYQGSLPLTEVHKILGNTDYVKLGKILVHPNNIETPDFYLLSGFPINIYGDKIDTIRTAGSNYEADPLIFINNLNPPTHNSSATGIVVVPDESLLAYKEATGWNAVADRIIPMSQFNLAEFV